MGVRLRVEKAVKSLNYFVGRHWRVKHKETKEWEWVIRAAHKAPLPKASGKMDLTITSIRTRSLDKDNLTGGAKGLVDALKRLGAIVDDCPDLLNLDVRQEKAKNATHAQTVIELKEVR